MVPNITFPDDDDFTYYVNESNPVTFECSATGIPAPYITWLRNGMTVDETSDPRVTLSNRTDPVRTPGIGGYIYSVSRTLTLDNTVDADSGTYTCVADNGNMRMPNVTQDFELFVNGKFLDSHLHITSFIFMSFSYHAVASNITNAPSDQVIVEPRPAPFNCRATGRPGPELSWIFVDEVGMETPILSGGRYNITPTSNGEREREIGLVIMRTFPNDTGTYMCRAENVVDTAEESADLTIWGKHGLPCTCV